eukprot:TRINITY_DN7899_c0_g1_i1.p1 TRINITY_DN7899_c0_g1~~TRINITY_DN7899_c0_g1_i1.p1  ORF type:complete len:413 (-),score=62.34 TRINITY_DN7899_c0_g1_i1:445-1683(-)
MALQPMSATLLSSEFVHRKMVPSPSSLVSRGPCCQPEIWPSSSFACQPPEHERPYHTLFCRVSAAKALQCRVSCMVRCIRPCRTSFSVHSAPSSSLTSNGIPEGGLRNCETVPNSSFGGARTIVATAGGAAMYSSAGEPEGEKPIDGQNPIELAKQLKLDAEAEKLLSSEESQVLLQSLAMAAKRVEEARAALDDVARQERELSVAKEAMRLEKTGSAESLAAEAAVEAIAREVAEEEERVRLAGAALIEARAGGTSWGLASILGEDNAKAADRVDSLKAAALATAAGGLAGVPLLLTAGEGSLGDLTTWISIGALLFTCFLFGPMYRYVVREDAQNFHLKGGAVAAFALARGLAQVDTAAGLVGFPEGGMEKVLLAALGAGESVIILGFCAAAVDYGMAAGLLRPFASRQQ